MPRVSVVLPVFNAAATVARAVESIRAQTWPDWELVAVDDGSTDGTSEILDRWAERGWLVHSESTRNGKTIKSRTTVTRINGAPMRVYQFARASVDNHVAEDEVVRGDAD